MSVVFTIKIAKLKVRGVMPPARKVFKDRKKEASRRACRQKVQAT